MMVERILARKLAHELTGEEFKMVAGAGDGDPTHTFVCEWVTVGGSRQDEKVIYPD